jgi:hypothetical protein
VERPTVRNEFESVPKRVVCKESALFWNGFVPDDCDARSLKPFGQRIEVIDGKRGVCFAGGSKRFLDANVEFLFAGAKPYPAAGRKRRGFGDFPHLQQSAVEFASRGLAAPRGRNLHVVEPHNCHHDTR